MCTYLFILQYYEDIGQRGADYFERFRKFIFKLLLFKAEVTDTKVHRLNLLPHPEVAIMWVMIPMVLGKVVE